ncbi:helix-turn-helix domain-containing protein [Pediococcus pentosaceus]|uniref:helix-turn-helix domain-containing protein n=1 Tax=Pediococcus pentosaceus TaxID=1255 RepID=UPI001373C354|nr:helix-turn-helix domain-containing protein [Pediococcus pentosaceus]QHO67010.1 hypothetical protein C7M44_00388 [Pediococcus pentosaceus]
MSTRKYKEIGERLQDARIKKGWTIEEVQFKLQISKRYLMALEAGENDDLPGDYYTQSLIKQYANLLEIDLGSRNLKSEPNSIKEWRRAHAEISSRSQKEAQQRKSVLQGLIRQHPWLMGIVLVVVIWLLVWGAFNDMAGHTKSTFKVPNQVKVVDTTKGTSTKKHDQSKASSSKKESASSKNSKATLKKINNSSDNLEVTLAAGSQHANLKMQMGQRSWNALTVTQPRAETTWQGLLEANASKTIELKKGYTYALKIGASTGFTGTIAGKEIPKSTTNSVVRNITIEVK